MLHSLFKPREAQEIERNKALRKAKAIVSLGESEGWQYFVTAANELIEAMTPDISSFSPEQATSIAAQIAFISGIKRCIGLMDQQKDILASIKRPEDE